MSRKSFGKGVGEGSKGAVGWRLAREGDLSVRVIFGAARPGRCRRLVLTPSAWAADGRRGGACDPDSREGEIRSCMQQSFIKSKALCVLLIYSFVVINE